MKVRGEVVRKWECSACNGLHDHEYQAEECCQPEVLAVWVCPVCEEGHEEKADAGACCVDEDECVTCPSCMRDHDFGTPSHSAVKIAGHCTTCSPNFTVEQQIAVQDLHYQRTGLSENLFG